MELYEVVEVEIPQYSGEVFVKLNAVITDRISLVHDGGNNWLQNPKKLQIKNY
ncbi:hypothetical protein [Okeania sp. KiyG1]|uniref:hypothetical protein n=1 Tax=Okeania sp. KiyG1 TaxID=2720165 RepID=UPI00192390D4|nr:hypothetical protein [Okeania sp. KiyG1]GGA21887.1 hypothetical protein CYANOKiyG1_36930 [Okeania sp. KiyG1]